MEALVGPLSPLTPEYGSSVERESAAVERLAGEIADLCCACVEADGSAGRNALSRRSAA
jgi:hypothetical protein